MSASVLSDNREEPENDANINIKRGVYVLIERTNLLKNKIYGGNCLLVKWFCFFSLFNLENNNKDRLKIKID